MARRGQKLDERGFEDFFFLQVDENSIAGQGIHHRGRDLKYQMEKKQESNFTQ